MPEEAKQGSFYRKDVVRKATEVFVESNNQSEFKINRDNADNMIEFRINADQYGDFSNCRLTFDMALVRPSTETLPSPVADINDPEAGGAQVSKLTQIDKMMVEDFASVFKRMDVYVNSTLVDSINDFSALRAFLYYTVTDQDTYDTNLFNTEGAWQFREDRRPGLRQTHADGERALNQARVAVDASDAEVFTTSANTSAFARGTAVNTGDGTSKNWHHTFPPQNQTGGYQAFIATEASIANNPPNAGFVDGWIISEGGTSEIGNTATMDFPDGSLEMMPGSVTTNKSGNGAASYWYKQGSAPNKYNNSQRQLITKVGNFVRPNRRMMKTTADNTTGCHIQSLDGNGTGMGVSLDFSNMSLFSCGKYIPLPHMNITIQLFLVQKSSECVVYADYPEVGIRRHANQSSNIDQPTFWKRVHPGAPGLANASWFGEAPIVKITRPRFHYRSVELEPVYVNEVAGYLRSGQNMVIQFDSYYNVQQTWDGRSDVIVDMTKTYTNAKSLFWGVHHQSVGYRERTQTQFCRLPGWQSDYVDVGSGVLRIPQTANIDRDSECVSHLLKSLGLPKNHACVALTERYTSRYIQPSVGVTLWPPYDPTNTTLAQFEDLGVVIGFSPGFQIDTWCRGYDLQKCHDASTNELCGLNTKDSNMSIKLHIGIDVDDGSLNWTTSPYNTGVQGPWNITVWTLHSRFLSIQSGLITVLD